MSIRPELAHPRKSSDRSTGFSEGWQLALTLETPDTKATQRREHPYNWAM